MKIRNPKSIKKDLDKFIAGQDEAKKVLSNALFIHYLKFLLHTKGDTTPYRTPTVLLTGGTGTGKTYTVETLAEIGKFPYHKICAKSITQTGYVGKSFEAHLSEYFKSNFRKGAIDYGIIHIDEVDKLSSLGASEQLNAWKIGVQHQLLRAIEGHNYCLCEKSNININTANLLIVLSGSFAEYNEQNKSKLGIGFNSKEECPLPELTKNSSEALVQAGLIPEFVGRISSIVRLDNLTKKDLREILLNKENSVFKLYRTLLNICGIKLDLKSKIINNVIDQAYDLKTGARGLKTALEQQLENVIYNINSIDFEVMDEHVNDTLNAKEGVSNIISLTEIKEFKDK